MKLAARDFPESPPKEAIELVIAALADRFGDQVTRNAVIRRQHANATSWHPLEVPDAVFFARSNEDVVAVVKLCADHRVPIIPYGTGTSLEAGVNAPFGGISLDLGHMNAVLAVHEEDMDCVVQAGDPPPPRGPG